MAKMTHENFVKEIRKERNRSAKLAEDPTTVKEDAEELENIRGTDNIVKFYSDRSATLDWVLGLLEK